MWHSKGDEETCRHCIGGGQLHAEMQFAFESALMVQPSKISLTKKPRLVILSQILWLRPMQPAPFVAYGTNFQMTARWLMSQAVRFVCAGSTPRPCTATSWRSACGPRAGHLYLQYTRARAGAWVSSASAPLLAPLTKPRFHCAVLHRGPMPHAPHHKWATLA